MNSRQDNFNMQEDIVVSNNVQSDNQGVQVNQQQINAQLQTMQNSLHSVSNINDTPVEQPINNILKNDNDSELNKKSTDKKIIVLGICFTVITIISLIVLLIFLNNKNKHSGETQNTFTTNIRETTIITTTKEIEEMPNELSTSELRKFALQHMPTSVMVVNTGVSDEVIEKFENSDVSNNQNGSIYAWMDNNTLYISNKQAGTMVVAPKKCSYLFGTSDYESDSWLRKVEKIDVTYLDVSSVTIMSHMFDWFKWGEGTENFEILGLDSWNVSNVTHMDYMFHGIGKNSTSIYLDLSNWNTSNLTDIEDMFSFAGKNSKTFKVDISNFNLSKVKYKTSMWGLFSDAGVNATDWEVIIPFTNGNNISNTLEKIYGTDEAAFFDITEKQKNRVFSFKQ